MNRSILSDMKIFPCRILFQKELLLSYNLHYHLCLIVKYRYVTQTCWYWTQILSRHLQLTCRQYGKYGSQLTLAGFNRTLLPPLMVLLPSLLTRPQTGNIRGCKNINLLRDSNGKKTKKKQNNVLGIYDSISKFYRAVFKSCSF